MNPKKGVRFQKAVYFLLWLLAGWAFRLFTRFSYKYKKIKARTFLLVGNHTLDLDPIYVVIAARRHMRFVASANIMRGFLGRLVKLLAGPIPRYKGAPADDVAKAIKANLAAGVSVATFPEGNTTWDGETGFISKKVAVLAKESGAALVTYVNTGGYLKKPRWAKYDRHGKVFGCVVNEYSPEELAEMSVEEVYEHIKKDLYVNAYREQEKSGNLYKGKRRAEGLEGPLYLCPCCGKVGSLKSFDNGLYCDCGLNYFYGEDGRLENCMETSESPEGNEALRAFCKDGNALPKKISVLEWSRAQKKYLQEHAEELKAMTEEPIFTDSCLVFSENDGVAHKASEENAQIRFFGDRMEVGSKSFRLSDISSVALFRGKRVFFTCLGSYFELEFEESKASQKYMALWRICTGREYV